MIPTQTQDTTGTPAMTINRPPLRFRHEYKHLISPSEDAVLSGRLGRLFPRDSHAGPSGTYRVCSLYFDTPDDRALRQKLNGTDNREKFRIRYYGDSADFFRLEKKIKKNTLCAKRSASLTEEEVQMILEGRHDFLLESPNGLLVEFYSKLKGQLLTPRTVVSYEREAFVYPPGNVRVTLDRHIRRGLSPGKIPLSPKPGNPRRSRTYHIGGQIRCFPSGYRPNGSTGSGACRRRLLKICSVPPL